MVTAMRTKFLRAPVSIKDMDRGLIQAAFSVFNVRDSDGDVVKPSFFTDGQQVPMAAWGHAWGELPPGRGVIHVTPQRAEFDGRFFMNTVTGREHFATVKAMGNLQEWSFGFNVLDSYPGDFNGERVRFLTKGEVFEVSPVLVGANRQTSTLAIKRPAPKARAWTPPAGAWAYKGMLSEQVAAHFREPVEHVLAGLCSYFGTQPIHLRWAKEMPIKNLRPLDRYVLDWTPERTSGYVQASLPGTITLVNRPDGYTAKGLTPAPFIKRLGHEFWHVLEAIGRVGAGNEAVADHLGRDTLKAYAEAAESGTLAYWTQYLPEFPWGVWRSGRDQGWKAPRWWMSSTAAAR